MLDALSRYRFLMLSVAVLVAAAAVVRLPVYLEGPGMATGLGERIDVRAPAASPLHGDFLLTTVTLEPGTIFEMAEGLFADEEFLWEREVVAPGLAPREYFNHQRSVFDLSSQVAAAVGLRAAGFPAEPAAVDGEGAEISRVEPGSAAAEALRPGDVVVRVNQRPVRTAEDLGEAVRELGDRRLTVSFLRAGRVESAALVPRVLPESGQPVLGVRIETANPQVDLPVPVDVSAGDLGGPSAGLMIALTVYDKALPAVDLAAGRRIAGTGEIAGDGRVLPIGGIGQKVVAAAGSDVDLFLAPLAQAAEAQAAIHAGSDLQVIGVANFDQAVAALRGGVA